MSSHRIVLHFPKEISGKPIIYKLVKDYDLVMNIIQANVNPDQEGRLIVELSGDEDNYKQGIEYLREWDVKVQLLSQDIHVDDELCVDCGVCIAPCPTGAISMNQDDMKVEFDLSKCVVCGLCAEICPYHAVEIVW